MIRALYTATSGMVLGAHRLDVTTRNLYYAQTPGYKATRTLAGSEAPTDPGFPSDVQTSVLGEFVDPSAGPLRTTGKPLDLALEGAGFFEVQTPGGTAYTRDGRFHTGRDKTVVNGNGFPLLGEKGPVRLPDGTAADAPIQVDPDGTFRVDGKVVDRLAVRDFPGYRGLQEAGGNLHFATGATAPQPSSASVLQRTLEDANASTVTEMTRTIENLRAFEAYQKVIQTVMDDLTGAAVRQIGRVA